MKEESEFLERALQRVMFIRDNNQHFNGIDYMDKQYLSAVIRMAENDQRRRGMCIGEHREKFEIQVACKRGLLWKLRVKIVVRLFLFTGRILGVRVSIPVVLERRD